MKRFSMVSLALVVASLTMVGCPRAKITVSPLELGLTVDEATQDLTITNSSSGNFTLTVTVTTDKPWLSVDGAAEVTQDVAQGEDLVVSVAVAYTKAAFAEGTVTVAAVDQNDRALTSVEVPVTTGVAKYYTQPFDSDLVGKMIIFSESNTPSFYKSEIADLPVGIDANMRVNLAEFDPVFFSSLDAVPIPLLDSQQVFLYGQAYDTVHLGSDGRITFENSTPAVVADPDALTTAHFEKAGISALYTPLALGGQVFAFQFDDRLLLVYDGVPAMDGGSASSNSFQVELFFVPPATKEGIEGGVILSWFDVDANLDAIVGLSSGEGEGADYVAADLIAQSTFTDNTYPLSVK